MAILFLPRKEGSAYSNKVRKVVPSLPHTRYHVSRRSGPPPATSTSHALRSADMNAEPHMPQPTHEPAKYHWVPVGASESDSPDIFPNRIPALQARRHFIPAHQGFQCCIVHQGPSS